MAKLQATYNAAIKSRDEARKQLATEINEQQLVKWELEHQNRRTKSYQWLVDKVQMEIVTLKSHMPMIGESFFFPHSLFVLSWYIQYNHCDPTNSTSCFHFLWQQRRAADTVYQDGLS